PSRTAAAAAAQRRHPPAGERRPRAALLAASTRAPSSGDGSKRGRWASRRSRAARSGGSSGSLIEVLPEGVTQLGQGVAVTAGGGVGADAEHGGDLPERQPGVDLERDHLAP